uniref:S-formylglutathione hydrolase n=1 Tax=Rhabditophanes sp. KR3021 TaxID=114890 RepID=A0AC35UB54_9BILA
MKQSIVAEQLSAVRSFNGWQKVFAIKSEELKCTTKFGVYLPDGYETRQSHVLFFLSGLTCTEDNFIAKSGFQKYASKHQVIVVNPDTSPRGVKVEGDDDCWDFGIGAGFYLDATTPKWKTNYRMYSYIINELVPFTKTQFNVIDGFGIFGHSMGGHGAITIGLKNPAIFKSISAFAAICHPQGCDWGKKALLGYLGPDKSSHDNYDAYELAKLYQGPKIKILLDQGSGDNFYSQKQLLPEKLVEEVNNPNIEIDFRFREDYNHSYFYIASFIEEHFDFHLSILKQ